MRIGIRSSIIKFEEGGERVFYFIFITRLVRSSMIKFEEGGERVFYFTTREEASMSRVNGRKIRDHEAARSSPLLSALKRVAGPALELDNLVVGQRGVIQELSKEGLWTAEERDQGSLGGEEIFKWDKKPLRGFCF